MKYSASARTKGPDRWIDGSAPGWDGKKGWEEMRSRLSFVWVGNSTFSVVALRALDDFILNCS